MVIFALFRTFGQQGIEFKKIAGRVSALPVFFKTLCSISPRVVAFTLRLTMYSCCNHDISEKKSLEARSDRDVPAR